MLTRQGEPLLVHEAKAYGLLRGVVSAPAAHRIILVDEAPCTSPLPLSPPPRLPLTATTAPTFALTATTDALPAVPSAAPSLSRATAPPVCPRRERAGCTCSPPAAPPRPPPSSWAT